MRIALATAPGAAEISNDDAILAEAIEAFGAHAKSVVWFDPVPWAEFDLVAIRTTWDYQFRLQEFLIWVDSVAELTRVANDPRLVRWNVHKSYLLELEARGIPIVPTRVAGSAADVRALMPASLAEADVDWVVKPEVGASGGETYRSRALGLDAMRGHLAEAVSRGKVLVQDYMPAIETEGEISLAWIDGEVAHAVRKTPGPGEFRIHVEHGGRNERIEIPADGAAIAQRCIERLAVQPHFARVDLVRDPNGQLRLMELELIEPELMFEWAPESASRLARALISPSSGFGRGGG